MYFEIFKLVTKPS